VPVGDLARVAEEEEEDDEEDERSVGASALETGISALTVSTQQHETGDDETTSTVESPIWSQNWGGAFN